MDRSSTRPNRSWRVRFTLRSLGLVTLVAAIACSWFAWKMKVHRDRIAAFQTLSDRGATLYFTELTRFEILRDATEPTTQGFDPRASDDPFGGDDPFAAADDKADEPEDESNADLRDTDRDLTADSDFQELIAAVTLDSEQWTTLGGPTTMTPFPKNITVCGFTSNQSDQTLFAKLCRLLGETSPFVVHRIEINRSSDDGWTDREFELLGRFPETTSIAITCDEISTPALRVISSLPGLENLILHCRRFPTADQWNQVPELHNVRYVSFKPPEASVPCSLSLDCLAKLPHLESLDLSGIASLQDQEMKHLRHAPELCTLDLSQTSIGDEALEHLRPGIYNLDLSETKVTDAGMQSVGRIESLHDLDISDTPVSDAGLQDLTGLQNLWVLKTLGTSITIAARDEFYRAHPGCSDGLGIIGLPNFDFGPLLWKTQLER